jgi:hypothetical protein
MPQIDSRDVEAVARAFIASHADFPSPTDPVSKRYAAAVVQMTPEERGEAFRQFLLTVESLPGGRPLLDSIQSIN